MSEEDLLYTQADRAAGALRAPPAPVSGLPERRERSWARALSESDVALHLLAKAGPRNWPSPEVLLKPSFLQQLSCEKRRADRVRTPLSLVVCDAHAEQDEALRNRDLAKALLAAKRQTDLLGQLGDGVFAVLLPDTGDAGAERFVEKVRRSAVRPHQLEVCTRTYPDQLFDALAAGASGPLDLFPFLSSSAPARTERRAYPLKRAIDIAGALVLLVLATPIMLGTAVAIAVNSRGPILFRQMRLGEGGVPFVFYKFRSMRCGVDDRIHRQYVESLIDGRVDQVNQGDARHPFYKIKSDPRVTAVGRILRKTSIDELPQLLNVLKGEMSLVGPRPPIPYEVERYQTWHLRRILEIRPGITGLWQVEGRSTTSFDEMVRLDLQYSRECSLWLDLRILLKTVYVVLRCEGAN
jgi:lipopolysaccharide/colanic/teichoic acid biosynthesis glycosyltransferase